MNIIEGNRLDGLPIDEFIDIKSKEICTVARGKKLIYFDLLHLINMRKAVNKENSIQDSTSDVYREIYSVLVDLISQDIIICPMSYMIFIELDKQSDNKSLLNTCKVIDEISLGISYADQKIFLAEVINLNQYQLNLDLGTDFYLCPHICVDIKFFKEYYCDKFLNKNLDNKALNVIFDRLLRSNTYDMFYLRRACGLRSKLNAPLFSEWINKNKITNGSKFNDILKDNINGLINEFNDMCENKFISLIDLDITDYKEYTPSLFTLAQIISIKQSRAQERARDNDFFDMYHSSIALAYSNYFFTEKSFHHLLTNKPFDRSYLDCIIESDPKFILTRLKDLKNT
ncbi:hypothetical protein [Dysgonomonas capnocytophagoides]|uniref:hypothetical protein n=1 Tax=Dysgonomonas capnocytophagoides TaxID=45254 RepID=UPI00333EFC8E